MSTDASENGAKEVNEGAKEVNEGAKEVNEGAFTDDERLIHGLLLRRSDEKLILKELKDRMTAEKLKRFNDKRDFEGRTLLVNAIHGQYENIVKKLMVRSMNFFSGFKLYFVLEKIDSSLLIIKNKSFEKLN